MSNLGNYYHCFREILSKNRKNFMVIVQRFYRNQEVGTMEKKPIKVVTIGGGSSYTPELMEGFIKRYEELPIKEICRY